MDIAVTSTQELKVQIEKRFQNRGQTFGLIADFTVGDEIAVIFGPSGAGKTTILECIAGLMLPDRGRISLNDHALFDSNTRKSVPGRERRVGYVFQSLALFPHMTATQNVAYGLHRMNETERESRVLDALQAFRISHVADRQPDAMSGGERQRVALARSLVAQPRALLLDEPMSALDYETKAGILRDLREWHAKHSIPVIFVTHSLDEVFAIGDRVLQIAEGEIVAQGKPAEVLAEQRDVLIRELQARQ